MGRKAKLTPELSERICEKLREGLFRRHAAARVQISESTLSEWYHRGANDERGIYLAFYEAVNDAEASFAEAGNTMLKAASSSNPKQVQWLLSRRFPELYGRRDNVEEISVEDKAAAAQATRELLIERLEKLFPEPEQVSAEPDSA